MFERRVNQLLVNREVGNTGLSDAQLTGMQKAKYGDLDACGTKLVDCAICFTEFGGAEEVRLLDCGHNYHPLCVDPWLKKTNSCPICKARALDKPNI